MWTAVGIEQPLSQGDLLIDVAFLSARLPLDDVPNRRQGNRGEALVKWIEGPALVVMQCCEIDKPQTRHVALAPIKPTAKLSAEEEEAFLREEPPVDGGGYVYDSFQVEPFEEVLTRHPGTLLAADLKQISSFAKTDEELRSRRAAAMSVEARRLLRIKLSVFYGRPTAEDEAALLAAGLPPGLTP